MKIANKIRYSFLVVVMVFTSLALSIFYFITKDSFQNSIYNNLSAVCASRAAHIDTYLLMLESSVGELSKSVVLENLLIASEAEQSQYDEALQIAMKRLKDTKEVNPSIAEFLLLSSSGKVVASSNANSLGVDKSAEDIFISGKTANYIKDIYYSKEYQEPLMEVSAPFRHRKTEKLLGVIVARVKLNKLNQIVQEKTGLGDTGEIYIVNQEDYLLTPTRFKEALVLRQKVDTKNVQQARLESVHSSQRELNSVYRNYHGVQVLGAHEHIDSMRWLVLAEIESKEAFLPLAKMRKVFYIILLIVPIVSWLLGAFIAGIITRSLNRLYEGIGMVSGSNLSVKVGTDEKDEVGALSRAFDAMVLNLKQTTTSIERLNQEINEHKMTEQALFESERFLSGVFSSIQDGINVLDKDMRVVRSNGAVGKWYASNSLVVGRKCFAAYHDRQEPCELCPAVRTFQTGKADRQILPKKISEGQSDGWLELFTFPLIDIATGETTGVVEYIRDITERKKAADALQKAYDELKNMHGQLLQSDKMATVGQLAAGVAHEINNPTGFVMANLDVLNSYGNNLKKMLDRYSELEANAKAEQSNWLQEQFAEIDGLRENLQIEAIFTDYGSLISESLDGMLRIQRIVSDLRSFSHSDEGRWEQANVHDLIQVALNIARNEIKYKATVVQDYTEDMPKISCYPQQLSQVFLNLIVNAVQAMQQKGQITIRTFVDGDAVVVQVADDGAGMSEDVAKHIFEPFFTTKPVGKGTGLGLSLAYNIIKKHNGVISVKSQLDGGTVFTIRLPKQV